MNKTITLTDEELQFLVEELGENRNRSQELLDEEISVVPLPWTPSKKTN